MMTFVLGICVYPILFVWIGSFLGDSEVTEYLQSLKVFPDYPTLKGYVRILLDTPEFFVAFGNSVKITCAVIVGQLAVNLPVSWWFARSEFKYKSVLYRIYIILMIMPFVVMMLPEYLALKRLGLLNSLWAVILPGIFSTFPVFVIYPYMRAIPAEFIETAKIDGAEEIKIFLHIGIPFALPGIAVSVILNFIEYWGCMEQVLTFVEVKSLWNLSLYTLNITLDKGNLAFTASVMTMIIPAYIILLGYRYLEAGLIGETNTR